jgi:hypothetical protein
MQDCCGCLKSQHAQLRALTNGRSTAAGYPAVPPIIQHNIKSEPALSGAACCLAALRFRLVRCRLCSLQLPKLAECSCLAANLLTRLSGRWPRRMH